MKRNYCVGVVVLLAACLCNISFAEGVMADDSKELMVDANLVILNSNIDILEFTESVKLGETIEITAKVSNTGHIIWRPHECFLRIPRVTFVNWQEESQEIFDLECTGDELPYDIYPGESVIMNIEIQTGEDCPINGEYSEVIISVQMIKLASAWFGEEERVRVQVIK